MIKDYIKYRTAYFVFYFIVILLFPFVQFLQRLPMESIFYSCFIVTFLFVLWVILDGYYFYQKEKKIRSVPDNLSSDIQELPEPADSIEADYQKIIEALYELLNRNIQSMERSHSDQIEYYTMWVHQIKTPISVIRLALQSRETVDNLIIDQELFKIEQYVEMALQYIKMNQLSSDLVIRKYDLKPIVNSSVKKYASLFIYKKLSIDIGNIEHTVLTDSKWLSFIIEQLLSNAVKYTNKGGIKIYWKENNLVIEDSGIGIYKEDMERIFEKGYTGFNGRLDKKASGIGLYLVKKVADALAVKVRIESEVSVGTKAFLTFPKEDLNYE
ncbi:sensor histidine kinase [Anaerocolumna sedimenticola]|uniref:histidine kinase n=1 Tax=Anaerocolumna sedimenticola TaxID=2696063 RepID=A0A6P1TN38_9FIRM|nr:sensor histidine kinase [Anaerocolumna sedimenticola]QHQ62414.1 sensor histidine kinase [Anaerocolumna sedimenticola]